MSFYTTHLSFRSGLALLTAALLMPLPTSAFELPLSDEALRDAYFLGQRRDDTTARFLEAYRQYLVAPKSGPHVFAVELFTPFALAVEASRNHGGSYSAQEARQDYRANGDSFRVGVHVVYTNTYNPGIVKGQNRVPSQTSPGQDFQVLLKQNGKAVESQNTRYENTSTSGRGSRGGSGSRLTGFIIWLEYDALRLTSSEATVEVDTPDGQHLNTSFDLVRLR